MSRIGKKIIPVPAGVDVTIQGKQVQVKGPKGTLTHVCVPEIAAAVENGTITVTLADPDAKKGAALWGLTRALIANMVRGVSEGYTKTLEINGVGYKAAVQGTKLILTVGFSHPVEYQLPQGIVASVEKNVITIAGIDRQLVGQVAAEIRAVKKPEPYKGKGIKYSNEVIRRKVGKVIKTAA
ncbi:MAG: 50S ribosomal protein L6 [Candidatus Komeilibacteria bacterium RIFCSPLOWO2_01_FULL_52_15]|uniref:Large ribosomal subunit protein uL6 n=2 Tax=Candidatus Komeiliibacteriota TaxID=1817908 RepID=A0A1G2BPH7_9BACT|nr:MAG: 50S ribosomal protein L6 [Candidatus Komeilibacteria bacterium RIFCSPHIGHO2_01_FULL_52_14]OGY91008.1 MAG: 50S ribosomal protein L6 [Candidatus Komeilibacteria bacterium RIFCSPLOWO2_01_FULL_52_15]